VQYIVQPAPEYVSDRAQIPTLAHAVDAQHLPAAIQQADEVRKCIDVHSHSSLARAMAACTPGVCADATAMSSLASPARSPLM